MLIFDQLKKNDPPLRLLAGAIFGGLFALLVGLWWVQIVRARTYQTTLETQSFRTVRIPAVRGKILDRNGLVLAESRPTFNISLYLEDLSPSFQKAYQRLKPKKRHTNATPFWKRWLGVNTTTIKPVRLKSEQVQALEWEARFQVVNNVVRQLAGALQEPTLRFDPNDFKRHYTSSRALPYPILKGASPGQIARFAEQLSGQAAADLEILPLRVYPHGTTASHVLGYLRYDDSSKEGEDAFFTYRLPDFRGVVGIEAGFDADLRGRAGAKSVLVNNLGYRQAENVWGICEPGHNVVLTLDLRIQQAAERAMRNRLGPQARAAVVIMDVRNGDILALASSPAYNPNLFVPQISREDYARLTDPQTRPQINRATQENYAPGSIFKTIVGLACLEAGLNPKESIYCAGHVTYPRYVRDPAGAGNYDFRRALLKSSNAYFITNGLRCGIKNIVELGQRFHLGERVGLENRQETAGMLPGLKRVSSSWFPGDTANICIGQGEIAVTPLQMAVVTSALANGGKVFWPRLVERVESQDPMALEPPTVFEQGRVRDELDVHARNLEILREAMLADTEDPEGTGRAAVVPGFRICAKTGTAQVTDERNRVVGHNLWFISFAPYEQPRFAVVVMVEGAGSGGGTCAPVARDIYAAIKDLGAGGTDTVAQTN